MAASKGVGLLTNVYSYYTKYGMTHMKFERGNRISYTLLRVFGKIHAVDKKTRTYGTEVKLHDAEIHMIKSIKENDGIHVTGLADILGVTKGAVSQILMKLEKKGMIQKKIDPDNLSRLSLCLTSKGEVAYFHHEELHEEFDQMVDSILEGTSTENAGFLLSFFNALEEKIDTMSKKNNSI